MLVCSDIQKGSGGVICWESITNYSNTMQMKKQQKKQYVLPECLEYAIRYEGIICTSSEETEDNEGISWGGGY